MCVVAVLRETLYQRRQTTAVRDRPQFIKTMRRLNSSNKEASRVSAFPTESPRTHTAPTSRSHPQTHPARPRQAASAHSLASWQAATTAWSPFVIDETTGNACAQSERQLKRGWRCRHKISYKRAFVASGRACRAASGTSAAPAPFSLHVRFPSRESIAALLDSRSPRTSFTVSCELP